MMKSNRRNSFDGRANKSFIIIINNIRTFD